MKKLLTCSLAFILVLALLLSGCAAKTPSNTDNTSSPATSEEPSPSTGNKDDEIKIAVILKSLTNPFWMMAKQAAEETGKRLGVTVEVFSTTNETDFNAQASQVEDAVTRGFDVICIVPSDGNALVPAVEEAIKKGVPVIVLDTALNSDLPVGFVASDNVAGGAMAAEYIAEQLGGKGKVAVIRGGKGHTVELERYQGFYEKLSTYPDMEIVIEAHADWEADKASNVMEDFLNAHPEIQAVFCESDMMVIGASQMARGAGRDDIIFVGLDGIVDALRLVRDGKISADVAQSPDKIGEFGVEAAVKVARGEEIEYRIITPMVLATKDTVNPLIENWEKLGY